MEKWSKLILGLCLFFLIASIIILSLVPPVSKDALTHHLFVPKLYLNHGGIYEIPWLACSYYPMNLDLLYTAVLYFGNDIAPKFIHFAFALGTCLLIFGYLRKRLNTFYGLLGAVFFLSIPIVVKLSITVYVDLGLVFFSTACLVYLFKWIENGFSRRYLVVSAVFCGLALGTKYNGLITLLIICLFIPLVYVRHRNTKATEHHRAFGFSALFLGIALLLFSPWMVKNFHWTGNPVYPLYNSVFKSLTEHYSLPAEAGSEDKNIFSDAGTTGKSESSFVTRRILFEENLWEILTIPVRVFFQGKDATGKYFDGKLSPFLFLLPFFAFLPTHKNSLLIKNEKKILLWFSILFLLIAFFTADMRIRYIAPIIPPLVVLSVFGIFGLQAFLSRRVNLCSQDKGSFVFIGVVICLILCMNAFYIYNQFRIINPFGYLSGKISRDDYIKHFRPEYPVIKYANNNLSDDARIFVVYLGNRGYYFNKEILFAGPGVMEHLIEEADSADKLAQIFQDSGGITHLFLWHYMFWDRLVGRVLDREKKELVISFFKNHTVKLFSKGGYELYAIK